MNFIPPQDEGRLRAAASGVLPNGKPVVVNADGTVSVVSSSTFTQALGSAAIFESAAIEYPSASFDTTNNKLLIVYGDDGNSTYGTAVVGTINTSDNSISFGTPVVFASSSVAFTNVAFSPENGKFLVIYRRSSSGKAIVATVSGTTVSFGTEAAFESTNVSRLTIVYNEGSSGVGFFVIAYKNDGNSSHGKAVVVSILANGTPNVYTAATFAAAETSPSPSSAAYDPVNQKTIIAFRDDANSNRGTAIVVTRSTGSLTFGSEVVFESVARSQYISTVYDSTNNKIVIAYQFYNNSAGTGVAIVGTVSGTSISFGTKVTFDSSNDITEISADFDIDGSKVVIGYADGGNSNKGKFVVGTVSGTSISFGSEVVFEAGSVSGHIVSTAYCSTIGKIVFAYRDTSNSKYGTAIVLQNAYTATNITAENYIGMSGGALDSETRTLALGSATVFEAASLVSSITGSCFDSTNNRVVIAYTDGGNSNHGTAIVGQLDGTSITFGTPVVFESNASQHHDLAFDSNTGRVVMSYDPEGGTGRGTAIVGLVNPANNSISFGTAVPFTNGNVSKEQRITFDSTNNKVVILYADPDNSLNGTCIVGTVDSSNNSISFGTKAAFETGGVTDYYDITFSTAAGKVVVAYSEPNANDGLAIVGTVSGTGISFGSETEFDGSSITDKSITYDSVNDRVVIAYRDSSSDIGKAVVGTVSGTDITFGSAVTLDSGVSTEFAAAFDPVAGKVVVVYRDHPNSFYGTYILGTVSGTSISFNTKAVFEAANTADLSVVYCSTPSRLVIAYQDGGNSNYGTSIVLQNAATIISRGSLADGKLATIQVGGAINTKQLSLTAGQQYFVQGDGTIGTTAASPSVIAGTAVSATDLIVKG